MRSSALLVTAVAAVLSISSSVPADHVPLSELAQFAPWDGLHTIYEPEFHDEPYVYPQNEIIGVVINGEARTYPIKLMNWHEVINDVVGGVPIVVAYCPLCGVVLVYERNVSGQVLTFGTSGLLYRNNKVLFDRETGSLWPMLLGVAINGTFHGTRLGLVSSVRMPYSDWTALHPDAKVVARPWGPVLCPSPCAVPPGFETGGGYDFSPYSSYQAGDSTLVPVRYPDDRLPPKAFVVGVAMHEEAWAIAFQDLARHRAVNVVIGGVRIVAALAADPADPQFGTSAHVYERGNASFSVDATTNELVDESGRRFAIRTGTGPGGSLSPVDAFFGFWFAWHDFYPDTRLFPEDAPAAPSTGVEHLVLVAIVVGAITVGLAIQHRRAKQSRSDVADPRAGRNARERF